MSVEVRLAITFQGVTYYKWRGFVNSIQLEAGLNQEKRVKVVCADWMDEAAKAHVARQSVQLDKQSDQIFATIVGGMVKQPPATLVIPGAELYPYAFDNTQDESSSVMTEFQRLAQSELGYIYLVGDRTQGGTLVFEGRRKRATVGTPKISLTDTDIYQLTVSRTHDDVINNVTVNIHPRRVDSDTETVLFTLSYAQEIKQSVNTVFNAQYRDPASGRYVRVGGMNMTTPVAGTDYLFNSAQDGSGNDLTPQLSVSVTFGGNSAEVSVTNNGPDGYLTKFQLRGRGLYDSEPVVLKAEDAASQAIFGDNTITMDMPYQSSVFVGADCAQYILSLYKDQATIVQSVTLYANRSTNLMLHCLEREPGDLISIAESLVGVSASYFINGVSLQIGDGGSIDCMWHLTPGYSLDCWLLDITGRSELDDTTILGYGIFAPGWVLGTSVLDQDATLS